VTSFHSTTSADLPGAPHGGAAGGSKFPVLWLVGCGALGFFGLGSVALIALIWLGVAEEEAVEPAQGQAAGGAARTTATTGGLEGTWRKGSSSSAAKVDSNGVYLGANTIVGDETLALSADGSYHSRYDGMMSGSPTHSEQTGTWSLGGGKLVLTRKDGWVTGYHFISCQPGAGGADVLTLMPDGYELTEANLSFWTEHWTRPRE